MTLALAAPASAARPDRHLTGEEELAAAVAGATQGKPVSCLSGSERRESRTIEGVGTLYRNGRTQWLNRFTDGCPSLRWDTIMVTRTSTDQLCRGDIAQIVDNTNGTFHGSCVFGDFVPYRKPAR